MGSLQAIHGQQGALAHGNAGEAGGESLRLCEVAISDSQPSAYPRSLILQGFAEGLRVSGGSAAWVQRQLARMGIHAPLSTIEKQLSFGSNRAAAFPAYWLGILSAAGLEACLDTIRALARSHKAPPEPQVAISLVRSAFVEVESAKSDRQLQTAAAKLHRHTLTLVRAVEPDRMVEAPTEFRICPMCGDRVVVVPDGIGWRALDHSDAGICFYGGRIST